MRPSEESCRTHLKIIPGRKEKAGLFIQLLRPLNSQHFPAAVPGAGGPALRQLNHKAPNIYYMNFSQEDLVGSNPIKPQLSIN